MPDLSPVQESGFGLASEGVGLAGTAGFCFFVARGRSSVDGRLRTGRDVPVIAAAAAVVMVSERRTPARGAFVMTGVAIGAETSSSWAIAMIIIFFNYHGEWLWWLLGNTIRVFWRGCKEETGRRDGRIY